MNADSIEYLDPDTIGGLNLYAYCNNNPVMNVDPDGHLVITTSLILLVAGLGAAIQSGYNGRLFGNAIGLRSLRINTIGRTEEMKCRRINLRLVFCIWITVISILTFVNSFFLISSIMMKKIEAWLLVQILMIPFFLFLFWLGTLVLKVIEVYSDKLIFKTILGKTIEVVPLANILSVHIEVEDIGFGGFFPKYYVLDVIGDDITYTYDQRNTKRIATPFLLECNAKNEKLLKNLLLVAVPDSASSSFPNNHRRD